MNKVSIIVFSWLISISLSGQEKVILDTDLDSDVDDVGALAMIHTLADHDLVHLLGVVVTSNDRWAPVCADAINQYFGRPDVPIGVQKGIDLRLFSKYTKNIAKEFPRDLSSYREAHNAVDLYRKILSSQPDSSVTIISIGHLTNLQNLLLSQPDAHSPLKGTELVRQKVKKWVCMGGKFPDGKEANFYRPDPSSTQFSIKYWPGEVVFAGWEIGQEIMTGGAFLKLFLPSSSPVWRSYSLFNQFKGRQSWDQAAVLYAILPGHNYWDLHATGYVHVNKDGSNQWVYDGLDHGQAYLKQKTDPLEIAKIIDALMVGLYP